VNRRRRGSMHHKKKRSTDGWLESVTRFTFEGGGLKTAQNRNALGRFVPGGRSARSSRSANRGVVRANEDPRRRRLGLSRKGEGKSTRPKKKEELLGRKKSGVEAHSRFYRKKKAPTKGPRRGKKICSEARPYYVSREEKRLVVHHEEKRHYPRRGIEGLFLIREEENGW